MCLQRHCRLKHNGNIQVIENRVTEEDGPELSREGDDVAMSSFNGKEKHGKRIGKRESSPIPDEDSMGILVFTLCLQHLLKLTIWRFAGYMMHPDKQQYSCSTCPFICKSLTDIEFHRQHHKIGPGRPIKCPICPFFVADKQ